VPVRIVANDGSGIREVEEVPLEPTCLLLDCVDTTVEREEVLEAVVVPLEKLLVVPLVGKFDRGSTFAGEKLYTGDSRKARASPVSRTSRILLDSMQFWVRADCSTRNR
jgi:hypothetical protein